MDEEGSRVGRFVLVRDIDGRLHALSATAVTAICDDGDGGAVLMLSGGRVVRVDQPVVTAAALLSGATRA